MLLSARSAVHLHNRRRSRAGDLVISQPWSAPHRAATETASSYLTIENKGDRPPTALVGAIDRLRRKKFRSKQISMTGGGTQVKPG